MAWLGRKNSKPDSAGSTNSEEYSSLHPLNSSHHLHSARSPSERDHRLISNFFAFWPSRSVPTIGNPDQGRKHEDIQQSTYQLLNLPGFDCQLYNSTTKRLHSPRLPRHVPIIIPDFAQPFAPDPRPKDQQPVLEPSEAKSLSCVSKTPELTDAHRVALEASQICQKETSKDRNCRSPNMNSSEVSLSASESGADNSSMSSHAPIGNSANIGISGSIQHNAAASNLSGLVCNVHRTTGQEPHPLVGATTTVLGDKLYVFGGRIHSRTKSQLTADLYELDLVRRHWTKVETTGDIPPPRYFHSACPLGDSKLVCYGGMSPAPHLRGQGNGQPAPTKSATEPQPEVVVMSDIHVLDVPTRTWKLINSSNVDSPQGRYAHCATILPSSAVFTSAEAPMSAIQHNPSSNDPHSGTLGVQLDGRGGAEMVVVGGQDSANNYIEQISVFNLRSLKWTQTTPYDHKCGAYKSMVAALPDINAQAVGRGGPIESTTAQRTGTAMLIYSNYNFLDVKLELQLRLADGSLIERPMTGPVSPPGLRFPNGGVINGHFVVSGTYLTSSKHEYALWALDLKSLTWGRIDTAGTIFGQGSWNRGILWNRRNTFVILGHRKRNLVDDYNHRRINFSHICMVELEAFGLYENPRKTSPNSAYISASAPSIPASLQSGLPSKLAGGRTLSAVAEQLGQTALTIGEMSDMEIEAIGGERIPCNSSVLARRWGPYFHQLMLDSTATHETNTISDAATLRPMMNSQASRISAITITPSINGLTPTPSTSGGGGDGTAADSQRSVSRSTARTLVELPNSNSVPAASRQRCLYLPHMAATIRLMLHYLYTSSLPPLSDLLCSPHTLCSLLQMARPYQIDGLLEATIERLHEVLDGRNAAAVFNAAAMAAGGGRATGSSSSSDLTSIGGTLAELERRESQATMLLGPDEQSSLSSRTAAALRLNGNSQQRRGHGKTDSMDSSSTATSATTSTDFSNTDNESPTQGGAADRAARGAENNDREVWTGDVSSVIGLQKRGLRGLMEGRRLRERANTGE